MASQPYRPGPSQTDAELALLQAEGQRRLLEASAARNRADEERLRQERREGDNRIREALASGFTPIRVVLIVLLTVAAAVSILTQLFEIVLAVAFVVFLLMGMAPNRASRARVEAEKAWAASCPFPMRGYFETLAHHEVSSVRLNIALIWSDAGVAPRPEAVRALFGVFDTNVEMLPSDDGKTIVVRTSSISVDKDRFLEFFWGGSGFRTNRGIVRYVHDLVDRVLLPLHRSHPIESVSLSD